MKRFLKSLLILLLLPAQYKVDAQVQRAYKHDASGNLTNIATATANAPTSFSSNEILYLYAADKLSLSSSQGGTPPFSYRWQLNSVDISGATNDTLFIRTIALTNAGIYRVIIGNASGSVTNQIATLSVLPTKGTLYEIAYGNSRYISVGDGGKIVSSTDFITWTTPTSGTTNRLEGVVYNGSKFVAVGEKGTVLTSTNGINWTIQNSGNTNDLKAVGFGNSTFVAVGSKGTVITSTDGY
jgi:hypothetical protein